MSEEKKEKFPSTFTIDNFSSTATLAKNEYKIPVGSVGSLAEDEYNPYDHRELEHPNNFTGALVHLLKSSLGTGILAIPSAFKSSGIIPGIIGTLFTGMLVTHTIHLIVVASQAICKKTKTPSLGFAETAEAVFKNGPNIVQPWARSAKNFVEACLLLTYYGCTAVYIVFVAESMQQLIVYHYPETEEWPIQWYMLAIFPPLLLLCQIRQLKHLVPFSFIANTTMVIAFTITLYYVFAGLNNVNMEDRKLFAPISGMPAFFSTVAFAMEGIGTMLPIENSLIKPQFVGCPGILNTAMFIVTALYTSIGLFGYIRFGDGVHASITFDLPPDEIASKIAKACITATVFFTFMLQFWVPVDITWRKIQPILQQKFHNLGQILLRISVLIVILAIAAAVPNLGPIIELVGSLFLPILGFFIPAVIDVILRWNDFGRFKWILWKDLLIVAFSIFALISGTYYAINSLIKSYY